MLMVLTSFMVFLSTPSARRATAAVAAVFRSDVISIHALREEGDFSLSGVTFVHFDFYPRPPRGGRQCTQINLKPLTPISIHALREEGDMDALTVMRTNVLFLSTPSARRATYEDTGKIIAVLFLSTPSARRATA